MALPAHRIGTSLQCLTMAPSHGYCWNPSKRYVLSQDSVPKDRGPRKAPEEECCIQVKGKRLDTETGIRTRSRAATQQERYEAVPAPVQIFVLLADMLIEAREGALKCFDLIWLLLAGS